MNYFLAALKKYAEFNGRSRRSEYWYFYLFIMIIIFILGFIGSFIHTKILGVIFYLAILVPYIAVLIRRMHDVNKSGWYCLIPIYNLILCCTNGDAGPNQYGPDPKDPAAMDEIDQIGNNK